ETDEWVDVPADHVNAHGACFDQNGPDSAARVNCPDSLRVGDCDIRNGSGHSCTERSGVHMRLLHMVTPNRLAFLNNAEMPNPFQQNNPEVDLRLEQIRFPLDHFADFPLNTAPLRLAKFSSRVKGDRVQASDFECLIANKFGCLLNDFLHVVSGKQNFKTLFHEWASARVNLFTALDDVRFTISSEKGSHFQSAEVMFIHLTYVSVYEVFIFHFKCVLQFAASIASSKLKMK